MTIVENGRRREEVRMKQLHLQKNLREFIANMKGGDERQKPEVLQILHCTLSP